MSEILQLHNTNLGDHIRSIGLATFKGHLEGKRQVLSSVNYDVDYGPRLREILDLLDSPWLPELTTLPHTKKKEGWHTWAAPPVPTKARWELDNRNPFVCYQFDSVSNIASASLLPEMDGQIKRWIRGNGFFPVRLGRHITLAEAVTYLAKAVFFVGVDSGFSHLAHCVGTPVFMYERGIPTHQCHYLCQVTRFHTPEQLAQLTHHYIDVVKGKY